MNFVYFISGLVLGFVSIKYAKWLSDNVPHIDVMDKYFGYNGTFYFWKIAGVLAIVFGFYLLFSK
jgi:hypothetical protein